MTLVWPIFARAFPHAQWLIVERDERDVINSLCRTSFMQRHSHSPEYWKMFCVSHNRRLAALKKAIPGVITANTDTILNGDFGVIEQICQLYDLPFDQDACTQAIGLDTAP